MTNREEEFMKIVRNSLETNGELSQIKSSLRLKILQLVKGNNEDKDNNNDDGNQSKKMLKFNEKYQTKTIDTMNLLIMDYFKWYGYHYSAEMFQTEANISDQTFEKTNFIGETEKNEIPQLLALVINEIIVKKKSEK